MNSFHVAAGIPGYLTARIQCWRFFLLLFLVFTICWPLFPQPVHAQENDFGDNQPVVVKVWMGVIDIPDVNEPIETFDIDTYLTLQWNDPSALRHCPGQAARYSYASLWFAPYL